MEGEKFPGPPLQTTSTVIRQESTTRMRRSNFPRAKPVSSSMHAKITPPKQSPMRVMSSFPNHKRLGTAIKRSAASNCSQCDRRQERRNRKNAAFPQQACDLESERSESHRVHEMRQRAQKQPLRRGELRGFDARAEGEASDLIEEIPMASNDAIGKFAGGRDPRIDARLAEGFENRARATGHAAVRAHQLHRLRVGFACDLREAVTYILGSEILNAIAGELTPIVQPDAAETAIAIVDQDGFGNRITRGHASNSRAEYL